MRRRWHWKALHTHYLKTMVFFLPHGGQRHQSNSGEVQRVNCELGRDMRMWFALPQSNQPLWLVNKLLSQLLLQHQTTSPPPLGPPAHHLCLRVFTHPRWTRAGIFPSDVLFGIPWPLLGLAEWQNKNDLANEYAEPTSEAAKLVSTTRKGGAPQSWETWMLLTSGSQCFWQSHRKYGFL